MKESHCLEIELPSALNHQKRDDDDLKHCDFLLHFEFTSLHAGFRISREMDV